MTPIWSDEVNSTPTCMGFSFFFLCVFVNQKESKRRIFLHEISLSSLETLAIYYNDTFL